MPDLLSLPEKKFFHHFFPVLKKMIADEFKSHGITPKNDAQVTADHATHQQSQPAANAAPAPNAPQAPPAPNK